MSAEVDAKILSMARSLLELHGFDSVVILCSKQEIAETGYVTEAIHANAGNLYAGKHLARRYAET